MSGLMSLIRFNKSIRVNSKIKNTICVNVKLTAQTFSDAFTFFELFCKSYNFNRMKTDGSCLKIYFFKSEITTDS